MQLKSELETLELAGILAKLAQPGVSFGLSGPLGVGKTTLVRHLVKALGIPDQVSSPTYVLEHHYGENPSIKVLHWDLFRTAELPLDLCEPVEGNAIRVIEWTERFPEFAATLDLSINLSFSPSSPDSREVTLAGKLAAKVQQTLAHRALGK